MSLDETPFPTKTQARERARLALERKSTQRNVMRAAINAYVDTVMPVLANSINSACDNGYFRNKSVFYCRIGEFEGCTRKCFHELLVETIRGRLKSYGFVADSDVSVADHTSDVTIDLKW